jgi:hypothetical protein
MADRHPASRKTPCIAPDHCTGLLTLLVGLVEHFGLANVLSMLANYSDAKKMHLEVDFENAKKFSTVSESEQERLKFMIAIWDKLGNSLDKSVQKFLEDFETATAWPRTP